MWPNTLDTADLVTFTEENFHGKLHFLCSEMNIDLAQFGLKQDEEDRESLFAHIKVKIDNPGLSG